MTISKTGNPIAASPNGRPAPVRVKLAFLASWQLSANRSQTCADLEDAIDYVNSRPRPLALYFFGPNSLGRRLVLERTTSGGVSINETNLHYAQEDIPFGGVGSSGMGAYHGYEGFKSLSHPKGIFEQASPSYSPKIAHCEGSARLLSGTRVAAIASKDGDAAAL
jgi:hypothetical protein